MKGKIDYAFHCETFLNTFPKWKYTSTPLLLFCIKSQNCSYFDSNELMIIFFVFSLLSLLCDVDWTLNLDRPASDLPDNNSMPICSNVQFQAKKAYKPNIHEINQKSNKLFHWILKAQSQNIIKRKNRHSTESMYAAINVVLVLVFKFLMMTWETSI